MSGARVSRLTVREVMHPGIVSCAPDTGAAQVARMMADRGVHCVAVEAPAKDGVGPPRVWGIISDLDVLSALGRPGVTATAADLASEPVITVRPSSAVRDAAEAMVRHGAHHVVVADPERHAPVGVLSTLDVAAVLARQEEEG
jgi:CBS domain-containing protein